jgi:hypothetical protein
MMGGGGRGRRALGAGRGGRGAPEVAAGARAAPPAPLARHPPAVPWNHSLRIGDWLAASTSTKPRLL